MRKLIRPTLVVGALAVLLASLTQTITAAPEKSDKSVAEPDMVIEDDVVSEWRNEKMTELTRLTDFARAANMAKDEPVLIFKHSTTCPISGRAAQRIDKMLRESEEPLPTFYMVKVIESKPVSQAIADHYKVQHESPQILLLKDGKEVWNTSHDEITAEAVLEAMKKFDATPSEEEKEKADGQ